MSDDYILVTISGCEGSSSHQQATRHIHWLAARPQCQPVRKSLGERRLEYPTQYGLYRHGHTTRFARCGLRDLRILVIDTKEFPAGTFLRDMEAIEAFPPTCVEGQDLVDWRRGNKYFGEYLSQGSLHIEGHGVQVSMQTLIDNGLFDLLPGLDDEDSWTYWANRVVQLRAPFNNITAPSATYKLALRKAIMLAGSCFEGRWSLPMTLFLLSLTPRLDNDTIIISGILALFTGKLVIPVAVNGYFLDGVC